MGHLPPIKSLSVNKVFAAKTDGFIGFSAPVFYLRTSSKSHVHAEVPVEQAQEMLDGIERVGTHGITHESATSGTAGGLR
jgi:hypothetical protein